MTTHSADITETHEAANLASAIIARRPLFLDRETPDSVIDALADDEERDLTLLADAGPGDVLHKARAMRATSFMCNGYSEPSPGEAALIESILNDICGVG